MAPAVSIGSIPNGNEGTTVQLTAQVTGGTYDGNPVYLWSGSGAFSDTGATSPVWTRPQVAFNSNQTVQLQVTVTGSDGIANAGTTDQTTDSETSAVFNVPDVTTETQYRYRLAPQDTPPAVPGGGESTEDHVPAGWQAALPAATETNAVYRIERVQTETGGVFTSATAWGTRTVVANQLLALADLDNTGLDVVAFALLVASGPGTAVNSLYADSDRAGTDTPLAGELGLGDGETVISRIRRLSATVVVLNDNDSPGALDMGVYFQAGGDGNDLTLTVKTATGEVALVVADQLDTSGGNFARLTLPATAQTLFDSIGIGDRWLVRFARPAASGQTHTVDAGDAAWAFDIPEAAVTHTTPQGTAYTVDAGNAAWSFTIPAVTVTLTPAGGVNSVGFTDNSILVIDTFARFDHGTDPDPELPAAWVTAGDPVFDAINVEPGGDIIPDIDPSAGRSSDTIRYVFTFESGGETLIVVHTGDIDDARFTPGNAGAVTAFYNTLVNGATGTVTISDDPSLQETPNPGGVQHAVNAGDAAWTFAVPEVSVTHATPTGTGHTVNAGNAAWSFGVPPVTVTFTPRPGVDYTRNAGNASWSFAIPAVTVTHTTALPQAYAVNAGDVSWFFSIPQGQRHPQASRRIGGLQPRADLISVGGTDTQPLRDTLKLKRSLADGSSLSFKVRALRANLAHIERGAAASVTDTASGTLLFAGHILRARVTGYSGDGTLVNLSVTASGIEQRPYRHVLTAADARNVNTAADASGQLAALVTILGPAYSSGDVARQRQPVDRSRNRGKGGRPASVSWAMYSGSSRTARSTSSCGRGFRPPPPSARSTAVPLRSTRWTSTPPPGASSPTALRSGSSQRARMTRVTESGVNRTVATITPPANTEIISIDRVIARQAVTGKFDVGDELDGVWDPDTVRFESVVQLGASETGDRGNARRMAHGADRHGSRCERTGPRRDSGRARNRPGGHSRSRQPRARPPAEPRRVADAAPHTRGGHRAPGTRRCRGGGARAATGPGRALTHCRRPVARSRRQAHAARPRAGRRGARAVAPPAGLPRARLLEQ